MRHALEDSAESVGVSPETCFQVLGFDVILDENLDPHLLEVNAGPSLAIDNVVPVDPREVRKGHYAPSKPANSRFMDASPVLHECASLDLVPDVCYCRDGGGGGAAHVHDPRWTRTSSHPAGGRVGDCAGRRGRLPDGDRAPTRQARPRGTAGSGGGARRRGGGVVVRPARRSAHVAPPTTTAAASTGSARGPARAAWLFGRMVMVSPFIRRFAR